MYDGLLHLHNFLRWVIAILLLVVIFQAFTKNNGIRKSSLWLLIAAHITLLIGIYQWFAGEWGLKQTYDKTVGMIMKNPYVRFWVIEHPIGMLIGIILITVGRSRAKALNYKAATWIYLLAFIIIMASVPWPFRELTNGRPWFPGMKH